MSVQHAPTPLTVIPERGFKRPGCDDRCMVIRAVIPGVFGRSELLLHDPDAHEDYGAWQDRVTDPGSHTVVTGTLAINLSSLDVSVNGVSVHLTGTELRLLVLLARRIGQAVTYDEILHAIGGEGYTEPHLVRVFVSRTREKLGEAGNLIVTLVKTGLRLENAPAGAILRHVRYGGPKTLTVWATGFDCRVHCGTTTTKHWGHGFCRQWACRLAYRDGWRPAEGQP